MTGQTYDMNNSIINLFIIICQPPNLLTMQTQFHRSLRRTRGRERFYSSMNYSEYCDFFGAPAAPFIKPQIDPQQIPELVLDQPFQSGKRQDKDIDPTMIPDFKLETIQEIDGSQNQTVNGLKSPKKSCEFRNQFMDQAPKRSHSRMRSQSENSEYLIFNFLDRFSKKETEKGSSPRKKVKCQ